MTTSPSEARLVGGIPVGPDGRAHGIYRHDPSTLRLSMAAPNLTNIPRPDSELQALVRSFFVTPGTFWARDFAGIEAVLVGFFANAPRVMRIFKLDGHSYFTAYALYELDKSLGLTYADLPQESWSDSDLKACLSGFKARFKKQRTTNKKITHGRNYKETALMAQVILLKDGILLPVKEIAKVMDFYDALFPEIPQWHRQLCAKVGGAEAPPGDHLWGCEGRHTYVRTPFGVVNRFYDVIKWTKGPKGWEWSDGDDAKRLVSVLPQSSARFILTRAAQRIWDDPKTQDVARTFRLFIHDELLGEVRTAADTQLLERCLAVSQREMERPIPELALPDGALLTLGTEAKVGNCWATMREV